MNLVQEVNEQLKRGKSISEIEKQMRLGKDTLRKKMRKLNYKFDRKQKLYVYTENNIKTIDNTKNNVINNMHNIKNNTNNKNESNKSITIFDENEVKILKEIIKSYVNKKIEIENLDYKTSKIVVRSFRSYELILDKFASFCKQNELNQKDAIATALADFMKKSI